MKNELLPPGMLQKLNNRMNELKQDPGVQKSFIEMFGNNPTAAQKEEAKNQLWLTAIYTLCYGSDKLNKK